MCKINPSKEQKADHYIICTCDVSVLIVHQDASELGAVFIGTESHGYSVSESSGRSSRGGRWHCGIMLETPGRQFVFMCEQEQEQREWLEAFTKIISQPMTPEDYASRVNIWQGASNVFLCHVLMCGLCLSDVYR